MELMLKIQGIDVLLTNNIERIPRSTKERSITKEGVFQGPGWGVIVYKQCKSPLSQENYDKLYRKVALLAWTKGEKTDSLRGIKKVVLQELSNYEL